MIVFMVSDEACMEMNNKQSYMLFKFHSLRLSPPINKLLRWGNWRDKNKLRKEKGNKNLYTKNTIITVTVAKSAPSRESQAHTL